MLLSIILCAHNPRDDYLRASLAGLAAQEYPEDIEIEFLLIDNASQPPLSEAFIAEMPFDARIIREVELGLTAARLRGMGEAMGELHLLVDDDNVLAPDYLAKTVAHFEANPRLGCVGGSIFPVYEKLAAAEWESLTSCLALRTVEAVSQTDRFVGVTHLPYGAGMALRSEVSLHYAEVIEQDAWRRSLDRKGEVLTSAGDIDLACTAYDLGLQCGLFPDLSLQHLIPANRTEPVYLKNLAISIAASSLLLRKRRNLGGHSLPFLVVDTVRTLIRGRNLRRRLLFLGGMWRAYLLGR